MVEAARSKGYPVDAPDSDTPSFDLDQPAAPAVEAPAAKKEEPVAPVAKTKGDDHAYSLEEDGFVGPRDLASKIDANPALKTAMDAETRNEIMANARLAEAGAGFRELFSSVEEAKVIHQTAQEFAGFSEAFSSIGKDRVKGTDAMVQKLIEGSAIRDAKGNIVRNEDGSIRTDHTAGKFFGEIFNRGFNANVIEKVKALGDENVQAALDLVMESVGMRPSTAVEDQYQDPGLTQRKADLDAQEARIRQEREASTKEQTTQYQNAVDQDRTTLYDAEVGKLLGLATGLDAFTRGAVEQRIFKEVHDAIKRNTAYQLRINRLEQQPRTPERRQEEVGLAREFLRNNLARIARPILAEAGIKATGKAEERAATQAARAENARSEVNGGTASQPKTGQSPQTPTQQYAQAREAFKASNGGREPSDSELNIYMMLTHARNKGAAA
jgi:hypothetical protein